MWILVRAVFATTIFLWRFLSRHVGRPKPNGVTDGIPFYVDNGTAELVRNGFRIGLQLRSSIWFCLQPETGVHRFSKSIGIATEAQTGDSWFDSRVYVVCDHPFVHLLLQEEAEARAIVTEAFDSGFDTILGDGEVLWLRKSGDSEPTPADRSLLKRLHKSLARLDRPSIGRYVDRFYWQALAIEGIVWSIAGYAAVALAEASLVHEDYHVDPNAVGLLGIGIAVCALCALVPLIIAVMLGSSRGHFIISETGMVLVLALPIASIQTVADLNRALDTSSPQVVSVDIRNCELVRHRRRWRIYTTCHLNLEKKTVADVPDLPDRINVVPELCLDTAKSAATLAIGRGALGLPWYREIAVEGRTWRPP